MKISLKGSVVGLAAFGALAIAAPAFAGCGGAELTNTPAAYEVGGADGARLIRVNDDLGFGRNAGSIVGMWSVTLMAGGNVADFGYSVWHSDGTEIMNSGGHPASTGNFCLGVWAQTGPGHYHLNHIALAYDPTKFNVPGDMTHAPGGLIARINLIEDVVLDPKSNRFTGTFTQIGYDPITGAVIPMFGVSGQIVGQRVTP